MFEGWEEIEWEPIQKRGMQQKFIRWEDKAAAANDDDINNEENLNKAELARREIVEGPLKLTRIYIFSCL